ncbi:hypothetical protein [Acetobacter persici]|uniref:hypothetical protein n=1 Tax=Acetobacter persici TaxID=1076596 RepID=UPI001BAB3C7F|nr:hypothetical protein [Acetobacter persici]MBS1017245.1 hypothetical protein [Acetobacter persici]
MTKLTDAQEIDIISEDLDKMKEIYKQAINDLKEKLELVTDYKNTVEEVKNEDCDEKTKLQALTDIHDEMTSEINPVSKFFGHEEFKDIDERELEAQKSFSPSPSF